MKNMKKWIAICAMLGAATQTHAVVGSWTKQTAHYPIYSSGGYAEMPFNAPTSMPTLTSFITSVTYQWTGYGNGNTVRKVEICYSKKYSTTISNCWEISNRQQDTIHNFDGLDASGKFWIRHRISGGTYPAISSALDTVTVMHQ
ncbi:hypothetical protein [Rivihabitans pingtungensis]|jgi:hypothetical protein|uniref:hypothetical protein n=1 Tax=Rivihabitans pingtungensis TaxID=1054498 RepID=UPI0011B7E4E4|nr:hypothetical protein [Rivihabitans pingtungensis]